MRIRSAVTQTEAGRIAEWVEGLPIPFTLSVKEGKLRSISQNALIHKVFGEIAKQSNESADQIKRECKFFQGCPILMADDPAFVAFVSNLSHLTTEEKIASMDYVSVTSMMTTVQLTDFGEAVYRKYTSQGIRLTHPDDRKYEEAA